MINKDKFGNEIYPKKFKILQENGNILLVKGYTESFNKPNLFFKQIQEGFFYLDMRGTMEVPIWEDQRPLFYGFFNENIPFWKRRRLLKKELIKMHHEKIPFRLSFEFGHNDPDFWDTLVIIDEENGVFKWDDGYCQFCNKDFQDEGEFCSEKCKGKYEEGLKNSLCSL